MSGQTRHIKSDRAIRFVQASDKQVAEAADLCFRVYKDGPLAGAFRSPEMVLQRWRWIIDRNPVASPFGRPAWVALRGDEVVAHFGLIPATVVMGGNAAPVAWGRDFFVDARMRGAGIGPRLVGAAVRAAGTVLVAGLNPPAIRAYQRVGFHLREPIPFYVKVLRPAEFATAVKIARLPSWATRTVVEAAGIWARRGAGRRGSVRVIESFGERFDRWWSRIEQNHPGLIHRSSATMNWRYTEHPAHRHTILELERDGRPAGIAVARRGVSRGLSAGLLVEILVEPGDRSAAAELVTAAERHMLSTSPEHVLIRANTYGRELGQALVRAGFVRAPSPFRWMVADRNVIRGRPLFLNAGDSDLDFV